MKNMIRAVKTIVWHDMVLVKISDAGEEFSKCLYGQTLPYVENCEDKDFDNNPMNWAYIEDYLRFIYNLPIVD